MAIFANKNALRRSKDLANPHNGIHAWIQELKDYIGVCVVDILTNKPLNYVKIKDQIQLISVRTSCPNRSQPNLTKCVRYTNVHNTEYDSLGQ